MRCRRRGGLRGEGVHVKEGGPAVIRVSLAVWDDAVVFTLYFSNVADVDISFDDTFPDWL